MLDKVVRNADVADPSDLLGWDGVKSEDNENNLQRWDLHLRI